MITDDLDLVAAALAAGQVAALPTDTVWGLAARLDRPDGIAAIFAVKRRPAEVALPVLVGSVEAALDLVGELDPVARALMAAHWPGALTVVVACPPAVAAATGATATVGLRCPDDQRLRDLLARTGPLATTSANLHGQPPVELAVDAEVLLGPAGVVLDGHPRGGTSSTVVAVRDGEVTVLRHGPVDVRA